MVEEFVWQREESGMIVVGVVVVVHGGDADGECEGPSRLNAACLQHTLSTRWTFSILDFHEEGLLFSIFCWNIFALDSAELDAQMVFGTLTRGTDTPFSLLSFY